jgi:hypothetical protein
MGLLVVVWVASAVRVWMFHPPANPTLIVALSAGRLCISVHPGANSNQDWFSHGQFYKLNLRNTLGWIELHFKQVTEVFVPIPLLITALLPLAIGPFISFRFRLWHYLAYTALVAVELAYYLRW